MTTSIIDLDQRALRAAFAEVPSGVVALCADDGYERIGMAASSFFTVSLNPPLVAFCPQSDSRTWPRLRECGRIGVSVLSREAASHVYTLASKDGDRFAGIETFTTDDGAVFVESASLWFDVTPTDTVPAGDHDIALLAVNSYTVRDRDPLVFHRSGFHGVD